MEMNLSLDSLVLLLMHICGMLVVSHLDKNKYSAPQEAKLPMKLRYCCNLYFPDEQTKKMHFYLRLEYMKAMVK